MTPHDFSLSQNQDPADHEWNGLQQIHDSPVTRRNLIIFQHFYIYSIYTVT